MGKAAGTAGSGWYVVAAVSYCAAAIVEKGLLNWFAGPIWLVAVIWVGPEIAQRVRGGRRPEHHDDNDDTPVGQQQ